MTGAQLSSDRAGVNGAVSLSTDTIIEDQETPVALGFKL